MLHFAAIEILFLLVAVTDVRGISGRISGHDVRPPLRYHQMVDGKVSVFLLWCRTGTVLCVYMEYRYPFKHRVCTLIDHEIDVDWLAWM